MNNEKNSKLSIMIIPKTRKVKRFTLPNWLPKSILTTIIIISTFVFFTFNRKANINSNLQKDNMEQEKQINELQAKVQKLQKINEEKDLTVEELQQRNVELDGKVKEIEVKLEEIAKLKAQLENLASNK